MGYRVCKSTGVIHSHGEGFKKECKKSQNMKKENAKDLLTKAEAEAFVRSKGKSPRYCCHCDFRDALQKEAQR